eukprot:COSAG01_NODE_12016_length_1816_cov_2.455446_4_plen_113_part_00
MRGRSRSRGRSWLVAALLLVVAVASEFEGAEGGKKKKKKKKKAASAEQNSLHAEVKTLFAQLGDGTSTEAKVAKRKLSQHSPLLGVKHLLVADCWLALLCHRLCLFCRRVLS